MATIDKILKRLESEYTTVERFDIKGVDDPVFFACNLDENIFRIVTVYLDSEIGGIFTLDVNAQMKYVHEDFDKKQAEGLLNILIDKVNNGEATVLGSVDKKDLH